ncbi:MAG TPA: serine hydrolase, partial [Gemmatimonadales bacterium]
MKRAGLAITLLALVSCAGPGAAVQDTPSPRDATRDTAAGASTLDLAPLRAFAARLRAGDFGNADHLVIMHAGRVVLDERFPRDYEAISRGKVSAIGCGIDACPDSASLHHYNYLHPRFHPWWQGGDLHTLQSVTKSVTATLIGIAQAQGEIGGFDTPLLSFFGAYDLSNVDPRLRQATLADLLTMRSGIEWHESDR